MSSSRPRTRAAGVAPKAPNATIASIAPTAAAPRRPIPKVAPAGAPARLNQRPEHAYRRIENYLRAQIKAGVGRSEPLPAEPDLAARFDVSRMTVRHAYQRLVSAGLVVRFPGMGTFVTGHMFEDLPIQGLPDLEDWVRRNNIGTTRRVLDYAMRAAPADVAKTMGVKRGESITYLRLLRMKNGVPCLDTRWLPAVLHERVSKAQVAHNSILDLVVRNGFEVVAGQVEIDAHRASREEAKLLSVGVDDPILERRVAFSDAHGRTIMVGHSRYPSGNAYTFRIGFHRLRQGDAGYVHTHVAWNRAGRVSLSVRATVQAGAGPCMPARYSIRGISP